LVVGLIGIVGLAGLRWVGFGLGFVELGLIVELFGFWLLAGVGFVVVFAVVLEDFGSLLGMVGFL